MSRRATAVITFLALAGCTGEAPLAPPGAVTIDQLPAAEVAELRQIEQAELSRIETRRAASAGTLDTLARSWSVGVTSWKTAGALLLCAPKPYDGTAAIIGPEGGVVDAGVASLVIPPGALDRPTVISIETPVSFLVSVEFRPHGLQFRRRPVLSLDYRHCSRPRAMLERVAYLGDDDRVLEWTESMDRTDIHKVDARLEHFSRYAVAF